MKSPATYLVTLTGHIPVFRDALLGGASASSDANKSKETEVTAELEARGLLQLQNQIMRQQDTELEHMEKAIGNTKVNRDDEANNSFYTMDGNSC